MNEHNENKRKEQKKQKEKKTNECEMNGPKEKKATINNNSHSTDY